MQRKVSIVYAIKNQHHSQMALHRQIQHLYSHMRRSFKRSLTHTHANVSINRIENVHGSSHTILSIV